MIFSNGKVALIYSRRVNFHPTIQSAIRRRSILDHPIDESIDIEHIVKEMHPYKYTMTKEETLVEAKRIRDLFHAMKHSKIARCGSDGGGGDLLLMGACGEGEGSGSGHAALSVTAKAVAGEAPCCRCLPSLSIVNLVLLVLINKVEVQHRIVEHGIFIKMYLTTSVMARSWNPSSVSPLTKLEMRMMRRERGAY
jgi:hypothetical protein